MSWWSDTVNNVSGTIGKGASAYGDFLYKNWIPFRSIAPVIGYTQMKNTQASTTEQINYNEYLNRGNERALSDWYKNVGQHGRTIKYPELSYPGQIYRNNTASARAMFDASSAGANFYGNLPFRTAGLYGIGGRISRTL